MNDLTLQEETRTLINLLKSFFLMVVCLSLFSCRPSQVDKNNSGDSSKPLVPIAGENLPPNSCRVVATVLSIDPILKSRNEKDPCSKAPCQVTVRVDSILGYGAAFSKPIAAGNTISVTFAFTAAPTKEILPALSQSYPGVAKGTIFLADILSQQGLNDEVSYLIYGYTVK